jgi:hypothetical protein
MSQYDQKRSATAVLSKLSNAIDRVLPSPKWPTAVKARAHYKELRVIEVEQRILFEPLCGIKEFHVRYDVIELTGRQRDSMRTIRQYTFECYPTLDKTSSNGNIIDVAVLCTQKGIGLPHEGHKYTLSLVEHSAVTTDLSILNSIIHEDVEMWRNNITI